ncbi:hypothetical protein BH20VER1_BH20VER1_23010 [soil metagenome]
MILSILFILSKHLLCPTPVEEVGSGAHGGTTFSPLSGTILADPAGGHGKGIFDSLLATRLEGGIGLSDLLVIAGKPPLTETHGRLREFPIDTPGSVLGSALINEMAELIIAGEDRLSNDLAKKRLQRLQLCALVAGAVSREYFKQGGRLAIVMRKLESEIPSLEKLKLPPIFKEIVKAKNGIVLVTGSTGSGKTTTLAAMLSELESHACAHAG